MIPIKQRKQNGVSEMFSILLNTSFCKLMFLCFEMFQGLNVLGRMHLRMHRAY